MEGSEQPRRGFWGWLEERLGIDGLRYPVPEHGDTLLYLLGGTTFAVFGLLIVTGFILMQFYNPTPEAAHQSVEYMRSQVAGGAFIRSLHYWLANAALALVILHMLRVFFYASFKRPREVTWLLGVVLLATTYFLFFTGTVLKWDQEAFEALEHNVEVGEMLGSLGAIVTPAFTKSVELLTRVYATHVAVLPVLLLALVAIHFLLIKRQGISPLPWGSREDADRRYESETRKPFTAHIVRLTLYGAIVLVVASVLALLWPAPLGSLPREGIEITKPPWPFLWQFPLENIFGVTAIPISVGLVILVLLLAPAIDRSKQLDPRRRPVLSVLAALLVAAWLALTVAGAFAPVERHIEGEPEMASEQQVD